MRWYARLPSSLVGLLVLIGLLTACPDKDKHTTLWLTFGATGLALVDHEPPPY